MFSRKKTSNNFLYPKDGKSPIRKSKKKWIFGQKIQKKLYDSNFRTIFVFSCTGIFWEKVYVNNGKKYSGNN